MPRKPLTPVETLAEIASFEHDDVGEEIDAMSDAEISAAIAKDGGDPVAMGERGAALAKALIERRKRLQWQIVALEALDTAKEEAKRALAVDAVRRAKMSRVELAAEIESAREEGFLEGLAARRREAGEATEDELRDLLEQIVMLRSASKGRETK
jgi:hypothetical protein